jgi:hypothetical protein
MDTAILLALLIVLGSVLSVLIIGSKIKKKTDVSIPDISRRALELLEVKNYEQAASLFRSAFEFEMATLRGFLIHVPETAGVVVAILGNARNSHHRAYSLFRSFVSDSIKPHLDQAWKKYCYPQGGSPEKGSQPFFGYKNESLQPIDSVKLAIENIEKLMKFAES